ncbi:hypothetical protein CDAR_229601 [Caerostris darwini]|uniref:Uncharacterized protein n=1 Tax=Caerostris darwini TaxID=1538125 RepID=A0AAV4PYF3_9ARAC|nr:hypothetical protein CDAR_229601 [Caerostris darwini]
MAKFECAFPNRNLQKVNYHLINRCWKWLNQNISSFLLKRLFHRPFPKISAIDLRYSSKFNLPTPFRERHTIKDVPKQRQLLIPESMSLLMRLPKQFCSRQVIDNGIRGINFLCPYKSAVKGRTSIKACHRFYRGDTE